MSLKNRKKLYLPKINISFHKIGNWVARKLNNSKTVKMGFFSYAKFSIKNQTFFAKRLSFLIKAGVPMLESIHVIKEQTKSKREAKVFEKIIADVSNGQTLSGSLSRFKQVFGNFAINIIKAGEGSGTLMDNLNYLADELKKKELLRKKIRSAMLYPIIVTLATFGIIGFLTAYIFPKIIPLFQSLNAKLPLSTRAIIYLTDLIRNDGLWILLGLIIVIVGIVVMIKNVPKVRSAYDGLILRIPIFGSMILNYNLTNTTRTLGLLLKSGISLTEALVITTDTTENVRYKEAFSNIKAGVMKGKTLSELINKYRAVFPLMLVHMISIGEKSGNLSNTLMYLSEYYENEFDEQTKNLSSTIEPVLMIIMGIMVGFVAISVITPIYEITNSIHK